MKKALFAPWRMAFIDQAHTETKTCVLCDIGKSEVGEERLLIHKGKYCYVVMNKFPYAHGHLMVVPYTHQHLWEDLKSDEVVEIGSLTQKAIRTLKSAFHPEGFNLGANLGKAAGAGIEAHVHQHIVPRWIGDYNFMPMFSETKVISEHLTETFKRIRTSWEKA